MPRLVLSARPRMRTRRAVRIRECLWTQIQLAAELWVLQGRIIKECAFGTNF